MFSCSGVTEVLLVLLAEDALGTVGCSRTTKSALKQAKNYELNSCQIRLALAARNITQNNMITK